LKWNFYLSSKPRRKFEPQSLGYSFRVDSGEIGRFRTWERETDETSED
jgi:hypothetical protein